MNALDATLVLLAALGAYGGFRLGLAARLASWAGLVVGLLAGIVTVPWVAARVSESLDPPQLVVVSVAVVTAIASIGFACGLVIGERLRLEVPPRRRRADQVAGGVAGALAVVVLAWMLAPAMADATGWPAQQARGSVLVGLMDRNLPSPPDPSLALRRILGDSYPEVLRSFDPAPPVGPPPASSGLDQATVDRVSASTVKVTVEGCGRLVSGSGFVVADGLIATNAHVVAGQSSTRVESVDGTRRSAIVVAFDPSRDVAILAASGRVGPPLPFADAAEGDVGAVFGHPGGEPLRLAPYEVADKITATGRDIYDQGIARRRVLVLAAALARGDSGSALIDPAGEVVGMTFALAPDRPGVAYALEPTEVRSVLDTAGATAVGAGACLP